MYFTLAIITTTSTVPMGDRLRRLLSGIFFLLLICPLMVSHTFAASDTTTLPSEFDALMARIETDFGVLASRQKQTLYQALYAFQKNTSYGGDKWNKTLGSIKLKVPWNIYVSLPADAKSTEDVDAGRHVNFNQTLMFVIIDKSLTAARYLVRDVTGVPWSKIDTPATNRLAIEIEGHVVAWALAHEVAHHLEGNVNAKPPSLSTSREWELAADIKAFEILNNTGFSLYLLSYYMKVMARLENMKSRTGKGTPEFLSDHPHWSTRASELQQYMASHPPGMHRWAVYNWYSYTPGQNQISDASYILPGNDLEHLAFLILGESMAMVGVEKQFNNAAIIYIRDGNMVYQHQILDLSKHLTSIRIATANGGTTDYLCFRGSVAGTATMDSSGRISDAFAYNAIERTQQAIRTANVSFDTRLKAEQLFEQRTRSLQDHLLDFFRGTLTPAQYQSREMETSTHYDARLKALLGNQQFDQINQAIADDMKLLILNQ